MRTMRTRTISWLGAAVIALGLPSSGCVVNDVIDALDGAYHHISLGTNVYVTIKRHATEEMFYHTWLCLLQGKTERQCGEAVLAFSAIAISSKLKGPAKDAWDAKIANAFKPDEALDYMQALEDLGVRGHECLRISIRSGENWTTFDAGEAECSWGQDPYPDNGV